MPRCVQNLVQISFLSCVCDFAFFYNAQRPPTNPHPFISSPQSGIQTSAFPHLTVPPNVFRSPLSTILFPLALRSLLSCPLFTSSHFNVFCPLVCTTNLESSLSYLFWRNATLAMLNHGQGRDPPVQDSSRLGFLHSTVGRNNA